MAQYITTSLATPSTRRCAVPQGSFQRRASTPKLVASPRVGSPLLPSDGIMRLSPEPSAAPAPDGAAAVGSGSGLGAAKKEEEEEEAKEAEEEEQAKQVEPVVLRAAAPQPQPQQPHGRARRGSTTMRDAQGVEVLELPEAAVPPQVRAAAHVCVPAACSASAGDGQGGALGCFMSACCPPLLCCCCLCCCCTVGPVCPHCRKAKG